MNYFHAEERIYVLSLLFMISGYTLDLLDVCLKLEEGGGGIFILRTSLELSLRKDRLLTQGHIVSMQIARLYPFNYRPC